MPHVPDEEQALENVLYPLVPEELAVRLSAQNVVGDDFDYLALVLVAVVLLHVLVVVLDVLLVVLALLLDYLCLAHVVGRDVFEDELPDLTPVN